MIYYNLLGTKLHVTGFDEAGRYFLKTLFEALYSRRILLNRIKFLTLITEAIIAIDIAVTIILLPSYLSRDLLEFT